MGENGIASILLTIQVTGRLGGSRRQIANKIDATPLGWIGQSDPRTARSVLECAQRQLPLWSRGERPPWTNLCPCRAGIPRRRSQTAGDHIRAPSTPAGSRPLSQTGFSRRGAETQRRSAIPPGSMDDSGRRACGRRPPVIISVRHRPRRGRARPYPNRILPQRRRDAGKERDPSGIDG